MGMSNFKSTVKISICEMQHKKNYNSIKCDLAHNALMYISLCEWEWVHYVNTIRGCLLSNNNSLVQY
jgi:hypothetical protein